jgi:EAL domain-containing protein (putative c-di-GMP-specific phosphodiesterase class I)
VPPLEFIPIAEDSGLILSIGEWVLRTATRQLREWLDAGLPLRQMSVNLSAVQFRHENLASLVTQVLQEAGLPPQYLELELTESVAMDDPLGAIVIMNKMHQCGIRMSIDDFGTGYSSLHYLKRFRVYKLKIDQSFVSNLTTDPDDKAIVVSIIAMAHNMGFQIVAEGVETQGQLAILQEQGCDEVQGFFYSPPLPADRLEAFLRQHAVRYVGDSMPIGWLA